MSIMGNNRVPKFRKSTKFKNYGLDYLKKYILCWSLKPVLDLVDIELYKNKVIDIEII